MLLIKPDPASGVPVYLQLMAQIKHAVETGALRPGEQLPPIRTLAETLVINPNTIARVYRELALENVIELHVGQGAFVSERLRPSHMEKIRLAKPVVRQVVRKLKAKGLSDDEIRRLWEAALSKPRANRS